MQCAKDLSCFFSLCGRCLISNVLSEPYRNPDLLEMSKWNRYWCSFEVLFTYTLQRITLESDEEFLYLSIHNFRIFQESIYFMFSHVGDSPDGVIDGWGVVRVCQRWNMYHCGHLTVYNMSKENVPASPWWWLVLYYSWYVDVVFITALMYL